MMSLIESIQMRILQFQIRLPYKYYKMIFLNKSKQPPGMALIMLRIKRYERMLKKYATVPNHMSFYCRPADEKDIPKLGGEYLGDICYCPRCNQETEKHNVQRGCGHIDAFYCKKDNLHWVLDCYGIIPPKQKWYGPFPGSPGIEVSYFFGLDYYRRDFHYG